MTKLINVFGAPASGKTSVSYALSAALKQAGKTVFLAQEFATELILAGRLKELANQDFIFAEMVRRIALAWDKVDYIITDCPILLNLVYLHKTKQNVKAERSEAARKLCEAFENHIIAAHKFYKGVNILLEFDDRFYTSDNRIHSIQDCYEIEAFLKDMFVKIGEPYSAFKANETDKMMGLIRSLE